MTDKHARRDDADGVITITFTRDDKLNAVTGEMLEMIETAAEDLANDEKHKVLVITGEGRFFTAGLDITTMNVGKLGAGSDGKVRGSSVRREYRTHARHDFYDFLESIEKPIILAAQGHCMGIGIEMGCSCDFRLVAEGIELSLPEVANLAVIPGSGGISRLTRLIGPHWTKWLTMAGQSISAEQAVHIGLAHAAYPADEFAEKVQDFARQLAKLPSEAMGLAKIGIDAAVNADRRTSRDIDRLTQTLLFQSNDFMDRQAAFANRSKKPKS